MQDIYPTRFSALGGALFNLTPPLLFGLLATRLQPILEKLKIMLACAPAQNDPLMCTNFIYPKIYIYYPVWRATFALEFVYREVILYEIKEFIRIS